MQSIHNQIKLPFSIEVGIMNHAIFLNRRCSETSERSSVYIRQPLSHYAYSVDMPLSLTDIEWTKYRHHWHPNYTGL